MAPHAKRKYTILPDDNLNDEFIYESPCSQCSKHRRSLILILASLELANIVVILLYWIGTKQNTSNHRSNYEQLKDYNSTNTFHDIFFEGPTMTIPGSGPKFWGNLIPGGEGVVSISTAWAQEQQLPPSRKSPTNDSHSIYQVAVFHQLHCLQMIETHIERRESNPDYEVKILSFQHILHCVDWIRQSLVCNADMTLDPTENFLGFGNENTHQCRDFGALFDWTYQNRWTELEPTLRGMFSLEDLTT